MVRCLCITLHNIRSEGECQVAGERASKKAYEKTIYPGIYRVLRGGTSRRYMVSYRLQGVGQRTKTFTNLNEARAFQANIHDPAKRRQLGQLERGRITLKEYFELFLERRRNITPSTRDRYSTVGRLYIQPPPLGAMYLADITRDDVERWISRLEHQGVGAPTIDKSYRTLRAALNTALREGRAVYNPAVQIETPEAAHRDAFFLTADQVDLIAGEVPARHRALVYFLAYTGVRIGEASALRVRHLDLTQRLASISENSPEVRGEKLQGRTKTKRVRAIDLPEPLCLELAAHLERFGPRKANGELMPDGWVFSHRNGGQIRQGNWRNRIFYPACLRLDIFRIGPGGRRELPRVHDLRHTAASLAAQAGYSLHEVKEMLGHSTIRTTSDSYLHLFADTKREKASRLGELMTTAHVERGNVVPLRDPKAGQV
jgi:integrase